MAFQLRIAGIALAWLLAGTVHAEDVGQDVANEAFVAKAKQACLDAARARGLDATKVEKLSGAGNYQLNARIAVKGGKEVDCRYNPTDNTTSFPGLADSRPQAAREPAVRICEDAAKKQDIRLGRFDSFKQLDGRLVEVRFDKAFLGKRHVCVVDQGKNLVAFDGGKPAAIPVDAKPK